MSTFITILIIIAAILLILLVLVQNSKGGGLASGFSSGNQVMSAPRTADFLEKATWTLIGIIVFLSIVDVAFTKKQKPTKNDNPANNERYEDDANATGQNSEGVQPGEGTIQGEFPVDNQETPAGLN